MGGPLRVHMAALTHQGRVREHNEDAVYLDVRERIAVVCDGMGGHAGGNIASEMAVQITASGLRRLKPADWQHEDRVVEAMKSALFAANDHILARARVDPALHDMGTTVVACAFLADRVVAAHVGDSRIYRMAQGMIEQITDDHSLVQERIRAGLLDPDSDEAELLANIVTRALGMEQVTVDITVQDLRPGDTYLLCSDGLSDMVEDSEMLELGTGVDLDQACLRLVDLANSRGGPDNITVALVRAQAWNPS